MIYMEKDEILAIVCYACCADTIHARGYHQHPELGGYVELEGACAGCPVATLRGDGAPIPKGWVKILKPDMFYGLCEGCSHYPERNSSSLCLLRCPLTEKRHAAEAEQRRMEKEKEREKERAQQAAEEERLLHIMQRSDMYEKLGVNPFLISDDPFDLRSDYTIL